MPAPLVTLERRPDGVALVRLDRPKANALSLELLGELDAVADALHAELPGAVVVWGGPRIFAAGADIAAFGGPAEAERFSRAFRAPFDKLAALPRVVVAAVCGYALGGGCELAMACDLRVVGEGAVFGQPEILLGIIPGAGGTQRLPRLVGPARAKDLILTGRQVRAEEAARIGLADRVVGDERVLEEALALAASFASGPLLAQAAAKAAVDHGLGVVLADGLDAEAGHFVEVFATEDAGIGIRSFLEAGPGKARFSGR